MSQFSSTASSWNFGYMNSQNQLSSEDNLTNDEIVAPGFENLSFEPLLELWRNKIAEYLAVNATSVCISEIGARVPRPPDLPQSFKLLETLKADTSGRFIFSGESGDTRVRRHVSVDDPEIQPSLDEWRETIVTYLKGIRGKAKLCDIGAEVKRPPGVPKPVKLIEVLTSDSQKRFVLSGTSNMILVDLSKYIVRNFSKKGTMVEPQFFPPGPNPAIRKERMPPPPQTLQNMQYFSEAEARHDSHRDWDAYGFNSTPSMLPEKNINDSFHIPFKPPSLQHQQQQQQQQQLRQPPSHPYQLPVKFPDSQLSSYQHHQSSPPTHSNMDAGTNLRNRIIDFHNHQINNNNKFHYQNQQPTTTTTTTGSNHLHPVPLKYHHPTSNSSYSTLNKNSFHASSPLLSCENNKLDILTTCASFPSSSFPSHRSNSFKDVLLRPTLPPLPHSISSSHSFFTQMSDDNNSTTTTGGGVNQDEEESSQSSKSEDSYVYCYSNETQFPLSNFSITIPDYNNNAINPPNNHNNNSLFKNKNNQLDSAGSSACSSPLSTYSLFSQSKYQMESQFSFPDQNKNSTYDALLPSIPPPPPPSTSLSSSSSYFDNSNYTLTPPTITTTTTTTGTTTTDNILPTPSLTTSSTSSSAMRTSGIGSVTTATSTTISAPPPPPSASSSSDTNNDLLIATWFPILYYGNDPNLINNFITNLRDELGFVSLQDLLQAQQQHQLTYENLSKSAGFKLGHFNRLIIGLRTIMHNANCV